MSWMDSWSRPGKQSAVPPPFYLTSDDAKYCHACGRIIGARRSHKQQEVVKYCSDGCRKRRLNPTDKRIDRTILALLVGEKDSGIENIDVQSRHRKGDKRTLINCDEIENIVFQRQVSDPADPESSEQSLVDAFDESPTETVTDPADLQGKPPNPVGPGSKEKQQEGQRRAEEREMVRRAARRAVVFGFAADEPDSAPAADQRRKCEAVMHGQVVEPSFAKGNWSIRWRE